MNVEHLIKQIKIRPGMYVGCLKLEPVVHFINGFLYNRKISKQADNIDEAFLDHFHEWVKRWLEKAKGIELESHRNYLFYISIVYEDPEECLEVFFRLSEEFFKEIHNKADKN